MNGSTTQTVHFCAFQLQTWHVFSTWFLLHTENIWLENIIYTQNKQLLNLQVQTIKPQICLSMYYPHFTPCRPHNYSCSCVCHEGTGDSKSTALTLNLSTRWSKWSPSCPGQFTPSKRAPVINWQGRWLASTASLDALDNRHLFPCRTETMIPQLFDPQFSLHMTVLSQQT